MPSLNQSSVSTIRVPNAPPLPPSPGRRARPSALTLLEVLVPVYLKLLDAAGATPAPHGVRAAVAADRFVRVRPSRRPHAFHLFASLSQAIRSPQGD